MLIGNLWFLNCSLKILFQLDLRVSLLEESIKEGENPVHVERFEHTEGFRRVAYFGRGAQNGRVNFLLKLNIVRDR